MDNEILRQIKERKSVRAFSPEKITEEEKELILDAAIQAPSAGNQQLYTILDITDQKIKEELAELCDHQPFIGKAPLVLVFLADSRRWMQVYQAAGIQPRNPRQGDAVLAVADACIAAQNAAVAAWSMGIGSCYIGDVLENREKMCRLLKLPEYVMPAVMLVLGRPVQQQKDRRKPARFSREYLVQENTYKDMTGEEHKKELCRRAAADKKEDFDFDQWVKAFEKRKYDSAFSREMSRSVSEYLKEYEIVETE